MSASAQSINEAVDMVYRLRPDVCLVSAGLESGDGMRLADRLTELPAPPRVLIYADRPEAELDVPASAGAGGGGIISRYADPHEVVDLIARVAAAKAMTGHPSELTIPDRDDSALRRRAARCV